MRFPTALVAATSIASASAFLVTPEIADTVKHAKETLNELILGSSHSIDVKCHECPAFLEKSEDGAAYGVSREKIGTTIHLEFTTKSGNLQINNETVFPLEAVNSKFPKLTAHQTRLDTGDSLITVPIDFTLSSELVAKPRRHPSRFGIVEEEEHELYSIDFTVIGLAGQPIKSQTAHARLVHHDGVYTLVHLNGAKFDPSAPGENDLEVCKAARNVQLCRVRLLANRKLREMMQAAVERASALKEWMRTHGPGNKPRPCNKFRPDQIASGMKGGHRFQHGGKDHHHGHRHRHHRIVRILFFMVKAVVIPAVLGFTVGFTVSAIGMLVGRFIVFVWSRLYRGRRGPLRNRPEVALEEGEKEELMADSEEPPAYEYHDDVAIHEEANVKRENQE